MAFGCIGCSEDSPLPEPDPIVEEPTTEPNDSDRTVVCDIYELTLVKGYVRMDAATNYKVFDPTDVQNKQTNIIEPIKEEDLGKNLYVFSDSTNQFPVSDEKITVTIHQYGRTAAHYKDTIDGIVYHFNQQIYPEDYEPWKGNRSGEEVIDICGTSSHSTFAHVSAAQLLLSRASMSTIRVRLYYHALRMTSGEGTIEKETQAASIISKLNSDFKDAGIEFVLQGTEYNDIMTSKNSICTDPSFMSLVFSTNRHSNGIDVYEMSFADCQYESTGVAEDIGSTALILEPITYRFAYVQSHEMGHCLGLYHTHRGTSENEYGIPELVNGSNGETAGDFIADTPADPNKWLNGGPSLNGIYYDANGQFYKPDPTMFMSYAWASSSHKFTPYQIAVMRYYLETQPILVNTIERHKIDAPSTNHFNGSVTLSSTPALDGEHYQWNVTRYYASSTSEGDVPITKQTTLYGGNPLTLTSTKPEYFEISLTVKSANTIVSNTYECKLTSGVPSPITGTLDWTSGMYSGSTTNMSHGNSVPINGNTTVNFTYKDKANAKLSGLTYRCVTATNRVLNGASMTFTQADCANGFLMIRPYDSCGSGDYFTLPVAVNGAYYAVKVGDNGKVEFSSAVGTGSSGAQKAPAARPVINRITVYNAGGEVMTVVDANSTMAESLDTKGWPAGEYRAVVEGNDGFSKEIIFGL